MNTATIITVAIMAVALVVVAACMIRLGYKALLAEWAIEAITKAEKSSSAPSWAKLVWQSSYRGFVKKCRPLCVSWSRTA